MAESATIWNLHLIYRLSYIPARFDDVRGKVRALAGVTSVDAAPSQDASTRLVFSDALCQCRGRRRRGHPVPPRYGRRAQRRGGGGSRKCGLLTRRLCVRWRSHPVPSARPFLTMSHCRDHRAASSATRSTIRPEDRFPHSAVASCVGLKPHHTAIGSEHHAESHQK